MGPTPTAPLPATTILLDNVNALLTHLREARAGGATVVRINTVEELLVRGRLG